MKIRNKHLSIFPIVIILYSHRTSFWRFKRTSNPYYLIFFFFFVACEAEFILFPSQQNREVLIEKGVPLPWNLSFFFILWILASLNMHKLSICSFIYPSIDIFCQVILRFYHVLRTTLVFEDTVILENMFEKMGETWHTVKPGIGPCSPSSSHCPTGADQSFCFLGGKGWS